MKKSSINLRLARFTHLRFLNFMLAFALVGTFYLHFTLAASAGWHYPDEADFVNRINSRRGSVGLNSLYWSGCLTNAAREHAKAMSDAGRIYHSNLSNIVSRHCGNYGYAVGENVGGFHATVADAWSQYMGSPCHQANIDSRTYELNPDGSCKRIIGGYGSLPWTHVGVGSWRRADGTISSVQIFVNAPDTRYGNFSQAVNANPVPSYSNYVAPPPTEYTHLLRNANSGGSPQISFKYGISTYRYLYCDWDGNGTDTPAMYDNGTWYIRNSNTGGAPDMTISYGYAAATPVCGDWNGDGKDTIGVYDAGAWSLRNTNDGGSPHTSVSYGYAAATPVVGDWDGNGTDTIGVYDAGNWNLRNSNTPGRPDIAFAYGARGYKPVVGDWDGNGTDTIGVYEGAGWWHLRNTNSPGSPNVSLQYGTSTYLPVVGDWDGNKTSTIGVITK